MALTGTQSGAPTHFAHGMPGRQDAIGAPQKHFCARSQCAVAENPGFCASPWGMRGAK